MANDNIPRGLVPIDGAKCRGRYYRVQTNNDIFIGEVVDLAATGYVTNAVSVGSAGIVQALGAVIGFSGPLRKGLATDDPYLDASDLTTLAAGLETGDRLVLVADDPFQEFIVQADTGGTLLGLADIGNTVPLLYRATSGDTTSGWANLEIDASLNAVSTGQVLRVLRLHDVVNVDGTENTAAANYAKWVCQIQTHRRTANNTGSAV